MSGKTYATADEHRSKARHATYLLIAIVLAAVLAISLVVGKVPDASAGTYNHISVCQSTLRGYSSDDDVHNWGVAIGARSFGGWGSYWHGPDGSAYVSGLFNLSGGGVWYTGRCTGGDYASDWFAG